MAAGLFVCLLGMFPPSLLSSSPKLDDQGTFEISVAGKPVGTEQFEIHSSKESVAAKAQIDLHAMQNGKELNFRISPDLVLNSQLEAQTYTWRQKGVRSSRLEVDFRTTPVTARYRTVDGKSDQRAFELPKDVVVLDDNVLNHYELLIDRYNRTSRGRQTFPAFIPQEALPGQVAVEETGNESINVQGKKVKARHYVVTTDLARIDLWADKSGRLLRISMPAAHLEANRR